MAQVLVGEDTLDSILLLVSELAERSLPAVHGVSVSLNRDGKLLTAAHSQAFARAIDEQQYQDRDGPCVEALRSGTEVRSFPLDFARWPGIQALSDKNGIRGVFSLPLMVDTGPIGALNLYSIETTAPSDDHAERARIFARHASVVLANAKAYDDAERHVEQLKEALQSREIIGQAKGILMQRERCTADDAFDKLREISQRSNIKLREVAQGVVDSTEKH
jgi:GAF domain-containing protein